MKTRYPNNPADIPMGEHFAILVSSSTHVPGDQRSIDAPGHGYPAHSVSHWDYILFETEDEWKAEINKLTLRNDKNFVPIKANRPTIEVKTDVKIEH